MNLHRDVYTDGYERAVLDVPHYAREASNRAGDAVLYLRHAQMLDTLKTPPADSLRAAIHALDAAKEDLQAALAKIEQHKIAAE